MNCSRPDCKDSVAEGDLCFAHHSARLIEVCADVMRSKRVIQAAVGGVTIQLHPLAFVEDDEAAAEPAQGGTAHAEPPKDEGDDEPGDLRTILGGG